MKRALALAGAALSVLWSAPACAWAPDAGAEHALARGQAFSEVSPAEGGGLIHAAIDIPAPARTVWKVMTDCRITPRLVTSVVVCRTLQADPGHAWDIKEQVSRGNFFLPPLHNVVRSEYQPYTLIRFHKAGGDLKMLDGEWRLEPLDGGARTRVIYVNRVGVNILAPAPLVRAALRRDTAKVLVNLRRESLAALAAGG